MNHAPGLGLLGLGLKAGSVVVGTGGVRAGLQRGEVVLVVVASDLSDRTDEKVARLARGSGVTVLVGPTASELGQRLGRDSIQAVGVTDRRLAKGLRDCWGGSGTDTQGEEQHTE